MGEIKNDESEENGAVDLEEQELGDVSGSGGPTALKVPNLFSGDDSPIDPDAAIKDLQVDKIRLPGGTIRANKIK